MVVDYSSILEIEVATYFSESMPDISSEKSIS